MRASILRRPRPVPESRNEVPTPDDHGHVRVQQDGVVWMRVEGVGWVVDEGAYAHEEPQTPQWPSVGVKPLPRLPHGPVK